MRYVRLALLPLILFALILIPFFIFERQLSELAAQWMDEGKPRVAIAGGVALLLAADVLLPVPSSMVSTASGYLLGFWRGMAATWLGMTAGCLLGYGIGRFAQPLAKWLAGRELHRVSQDTSYWVMAATRAVPVLAEASVLVCGMAARPLLPFLAVCSLANLGISAVYAAVGAWALEMESFLLAFLGSLVLPALVVWLPGSGRRVGLRKPVRGGARES